MTDDEKPQKNPLGPTGEQVRHNLRQLRDDRKLTYRELSDQLRDLGRPVPTLGLSRIENGARRVDADDLVALAVALSVNPSRLLLPPTAGDDPVNLTPGKQVTAWQAWQWADGRFPLPTRGGDDQESPYNTDAELEDFQLLARPAELRAGENHTAMRAASDVAGRLRRILAVPATDAAAQKARGDALRRALARLTAEVDDLLDGADGER